MINLKDVNAAVKAIREQRDAKKARAMKDKLYTDVLRSISTGKCVYPPQCSAAALEAETASTHD